MLRSVDPEDAHTHAGDWLTVGTLPPKWKEAGHHPGDSTQQELASWDWNLPYAWYFPTACPHESLCLAWYGTWPREWGRHRVNSDLLQPSSTWPDMGAWTDPQSPVQLREHSLENIKLK